MISDSSATTWCDHILK